MKASASRGGVRLLAICAALNLTLAALGWLWQGGYVSTALVARLSRGGALSLGSWNWNGVHVLLWWVWLSGWFAFVAAKGQSDRAHGPDLHKPAMTAAAAGSAASLFWLWALWDVAQRLWTIDSGQLASSSAAAGLLRWTGLPLAIGAGTAIVAAIVLFRWRFPAGDEPSTRTEDATSRGDAPVGDAERPKETESPAPPQSPLRTLQLGLTLVSLAAFGLFWQFIAFGPAETTWSLDRLFRGPAAEGWAALTFLAVAHATHIASGALTVFERRDRLKTDEPARDDDDEEIEPASGNEPA